MRAASYTWDGGGSDLIWGNAANWTTDTLPTGADTVYFGGGVTPNATISLGASQSIQELRMNTFSEVPVFTIGSAADIMAGHTLTLTNVFRDDFNGNTQTIAANVILAANSTWNIVRGYNNGVAVTGNISGIGVSLTKTGTGSLTLTGANTYTGGTTISDGSLTLGNSAGNGSVTGDIVNNGNLTFNNPFAQTSGNISGSGSITKSGAGTLTLAGSTSATSSGKFTINGGGLDTSLAGMVLTNSSYAWDGDFTYVGTNSLDLGTGGVALNNNRTVTVSANTLIVGGVISGSSRILTKAGDGTLQLNAAGTYSGGTVINGGAINLTGSGKIGTGNLTINNAGILTLDNTSANADRIANSAAVTLSGRLNLIGNASTATSETAGALTGGNAEGVLTLTPGSGQSALLTFSSLAARAVGSGSTGLFRGTGLGSTLGADTSNIIFTTAPTVTALGAFAATDGVGTLGTANAAVLRGILFDNSATGTGLGFATYDATNGVRLLNASNEQTTSYAAGDSNVRLDLTADVGITGDATNTLQLDNVSGSAHVVTNTGSALAPQNGLLFTGSSAITLTGGTLNANTNTSNKEAIILSANTAGVTIGTALTGDNVTIGGTGDITFNGAITGKALTANAVRFNGSGTSTLAASVTGAIVVNNGTLKLATGGSLYGATATGGNPSTINLTVNRLGTLDMNGISSTTNAFQGSGVITNTSGTLATLSTNYQPGGGNYAVISPEFSGNITGNIKLSIGGGGYYIFNYTQTLSGDNSFTGGVAMSGSGQTLRLKSATALGTGTLTLAGGAKLDSNNQTLTTNNAQTWNGAWTYTGANGSLNMGSGAVTLGANSGVTVSANKLTIGGNIGETGGARTFTKAGTGTLILDGTNTYTGATTINGGSFIVNGSLAAGSAVTVKSGATLGGSGTIGGVVTVDSGGFLAPGNSPGVLTVGSLNLQSGSTTTLEIGGSAVRGTDFDGINITTASGLTYGGALSFSFTSTLADGASLNLFNFTGTAGGEFSSVSSTGSYAGTWTLGSGMWTLDSGGQSLAFNQATGNLSLIPEPSTFAMLGGVISLAFASFRRSRKRA